VSHLPFAAVTTADAGEPYYSLGRLEGATKNEPAGKASTTTWSGVASPNGAVSKFDYGHHVSSPLVSGRPLFQQLSCRRAPLSSGFVSSRSEAFGSKVGSLARELSPSRRRNSGFSSAT